MVMGVSGDWWHSDSVTGDDASIVEVEAHHRDRDVATVRVRIAWTVVIAVGLARTREAHTVATAKKSTEASEEGETELRFGDMKAAVQQGEKKDNYTGGYHCLRILRINLKCKGSRTNYE